MAPDHPRRFLSIPDFPELPSGRASARFRRAPVQFTSFVGREREISTVRTALSATRLLTLTGAGGSGKTRLALEVSLQELEASGIEGAWVELAPLFDPSLIGDTVLAALDARDESDTPAVRRIATEVADRPFLLILDNAEHLIDGCSAFVDAVLREAPLLKVLVTSRAALGVGGETAWLVPPLSLTSGLPSGESEAVQLFVQRAEAASASFQLTDENRAAVFRICQQLDGLPLALELAAARVRALTPEQLAARLDDRFRILTTGNRAALPRQQTLRATIDWSYDLLADAERQLFARLAVFRGSFTLEAVEAVGAGGAISTADVLDVLASLVDKSLVEVLESGGQARYRMLETMREYAAERLSESGETELRMRAHAAFYGSLIRELEPLLRTSQRPAAMARLMPELENLRTAMSCSRMCDVQIHLRIVGLLHWFWFGSGQWPEAQEWLRGALELPEAKQPTIDRAYLLFSAGAIASLQARSPDARRLLEEAEQIADREKDETLLANILNYLGMALNQMRDPQALAVVLRARPWMLKVNDLNGLRLNFLLQGQALLQQGDLAGAVEASEEGVRVARAFGLQRELGIALQQLASVVARADDWGRTRALLGESLQALSNDPMPLFISRALELMGSSASAAGAWEDTGILHGAAESIRQSIGAAMWAVDRDQHASFIEHARSALGSARWEQALASGRALGVDLAVRHALAVGERLGRTQEPDRTSDTGMYETRSLAQTDQFAGPVLVVRALGGLEIWVDGTPLTRKEWASSKARELLLFLLLHPGGRTREQVGVELWPDASSAQLRSNFHVAMHYLRKALRHPEWVIFERDQYRVAVPDGVDFDAEKFERDITRALRSVRRGSPSVEDLDAAVRLYRGEFLDGERMGDWQHDTRARLARLHADGVEALGRTLLSTGRKVEAVDVLEQLVKRDPLLESACRALMLARAQSGDLSGAMRDYRQLEAALRREGMPGPSRETRDLRSRLEQGDAA